MNIEEVLKLPTLPLRDVVVYPNMVIPLFVGRQSSISALEQAMESEEKQIFLLTQRDAAIDEPTVENLFGFGVVATILQLLKLPDGTVKVLVEGKRRAQFRQVLEDKPFFTMEVACLELTRLSPQEEEILLRTVVSQFERYAKLNKKISQEIVSSIVAIDEPSRLADGIASNMSLKIDERQNLLEMTDLRQRLERLLTLMEAEIDLLQVEQRIRGNVKKQMEKSQREYYLNEQMKAIQEELGHEASESEVMKKKIEESGMTKEASAKCLAELDKLKMMPQMSAEATVCRNFLDWMLQVPWKKRTKIKFNLNEAQDTLDKEHFGLEKVKERILEYLAVQKRVKKIRGPILCLVGPPGVGKTSLGQSIANAVHRKFVRISLGGVRDEAEIRGHRRTYIGAMPGKIIQKLAKTGVKNPLVLLDEIDKMASDFRGDPAAALLEVLDPEQNTSFNDHFLEVDYDLSDVMFVCTANSFDIPGPLLDRMEVINLSGYTEDEKLNIASSYLLPKQVKLNGVKDKELNIDDGVMLDVIRYYTRESGVRGLDRQISKLCRKIVKEMLSQKGEEKQVPHITRENLEDVLGVKKYRFGRAEENDQIGQVTGLAWTQVGGEILSIEVSVIAGKGKTLRTGKLGDVMQESIQAALTVVRGMAHELDIDEDFHETKDIHVHVPEGATPKDGPSAGIGMCTALVSALTQVPVRADVAMTGEITLRGEVLPIGGLKEKLLAARRAGITDVVIPKENSRDLRDIPDNVKQDLSIHCVQWIHEVLSIALRDCPQKPGKLYCNKDVLTLAPATNSEDDDDIPNVNQH
jgi:ATP-dependent Lon protease